MPLSSAARYNLRRLHSLTGVVPVGLFLLEHFFTNSFAMYGAQAYAEKVQFLQSLPYVLALEVGLIFVPLLFHAVLGVFIWMESKGNVTRYGYFRNWMFAIQRISGVYLFFFVIVHVWKARFQGVAPEGMFEHMAAYLNFDTPANVAWVAAYALGVVFASFHFGNGLFTFAISWGLLPGVRSQKWAQWACLAIFAVMALAGLNSLLAFQDKSLRFLNSPHARPEVHGSVVESAHGAAGGSQR